MKKLSVLIIILFIVFYPFLRTMAQSVSDLDVTGLERQSSASESKVAKNPFAQGAPAVEDLVIEDLQLTGVAYKNEREGYALISGYLVKPGDKIAGYRVDKIAKNKVHLKRLDEAVVLSIGGGI